MTRISGRLRHTSTQIPAGKLISHSLEIRISASRRPKIEREDDPDQGDLEVDQEALEEEPEVVAGPDPLPVVGVEEVVHRGPHRLIANRRSR